MADESEQFVVDASSNLQADTMVQFAIDAVHVAGYPPISSRTGKGQIHPEVYIGCPNEKQSQLMKIEIDGADGVLS